VSLTGIEAQMPHHRELADLSAHRDPKRMTLSAGLALGLSAQIGLTAHLYSLLVPALGAKQAGLAMALVTIMAIAGRTLIGSLMPLGADRRMVACGGYAVQIAGSMTFILASGTSVPLLLVGVVLFGAGFGNATSLPPLIAQVEFVQEDVPRVVALIVAIAQGGYAIAPAFFGLIRELTSPANDFAAGVAPAVFVAAAVVQCLAVGTFLLGRRQ
jgi:MFS family permease